MTIAANDVAVAVWAGQRATADLIELGVLSPGMRLAHTHQLEEGGTAWRLWTECGTRIVVDWPPAHRVLDALWPHCSWRQWAQWMAYPRRWHMPRGLPSRLLDFPERPTHGLTRTNDMPAVIWAASCAQHFARVEAWREACNQMWADHIWPERP